MTHRNHNDHRWSTAAGLRAARANPLKAVVRLAAFGVALLAATPAPAAALSADGLRIGSHAAHVRVVVDLSGGMPGLGDTRVNYVIPMDGEARVDILRSSVARAVTRSAHGVTARLSPGPGRAVVHMKSARNSVKYVRITRLRGPARIAIDLIRSRPPVAGANVARDRCLSLTGVAASERGFRVRGVARLVEGGVNVRVRDARGRQVGRYILHKEDGRWDVRVAYAVSRVQAGTVEATTTSVLDGGLGCLVQRRVTLRP